MQVHEHLYPYLRSCDPASNTLIPFVLAQLAERAVESKQMGPQKVTVVKQK